MSSDIDFLITAVESIPDFRQLYKVSEWAENKRYLPPELSPVSGYWDNAVTPYLPEIMDCFSDSSPIREVAFMKGAQIGATTGILENIIGYTIDVSPAPMMYVSADKNLTEQAMELRVDRMIDSSGLSGRIFSQGGGKNDKYNRKTGSTKSKKEFSGGFLLAVGARNPSKLRQVSIKKLLLDEVDGFPQEAGKEGDPVSLAVKRTNAYENVRKILYISTPHILQTSKINKAFQSGDQRKFFVPCKHCKEYQELVFAGEGFGIFYEKDENDNLIVDSVHYKCKYCQGKWKNSDKSWFLPKGKWVPQAISVDPAYRSYHLNSLYSPVAMYSWEKAVRDWIDAQRSTDKLKTFKNTVLGEPWEERGETPSYQHIMANRMEYESGTIPKEVLFLSLAADVHKSRIDVEVVGWADNCVSYSIDWLHFEGDTENLEGKAWKDFELFIQSGYGNKQILIAMIDSGYLTDIVYNFCSKFGTGIYPIKGLTRSYNDRAAFRKKNVEGYDGLIGVDAYVDFYKDRLKGWLTLAVQDGKAPWGYCYYPSNYTEEYFKQYSNEQKFEKRDTRGQLVGYEWRKRNANAANHAWDCRIYNMVAFDVLLDLVREYRQLENLSIEDFFVYLKANIN